MSLRNTLTYTDYNIDTRIFQPKFRYATPAVPQRNTFINVTLSDLILIAESQAEKERETPSLIAPDSPERYASWATTVELLKTMKERGVPEALRDPKPGE